MNNLFCCRFEIVFVGGEKHNKSKEELAEQEREPQRIDCLVIVVALDNQANAFLLSILCC